MLTSETRRAEPTTLGSNEGSDGSGTRSPGGREQDADQTSRHTSVNVTDSRVDEYPTLHAVRQVARQVTRELEAARQIESVERFAHIVRRNRDLARHGRMTRL